MRKTKDRVRERLPQSICQKVTRRIHANKNCVRKLGWPRDVCVWGSTVIAVEKTHWSTEHRWPGLSSTENEVDFQTAECFPRGSCGNCGNSAAISLHFFFGHRQSRERRVQSSPWTIASSILHCLNWPLAFTSIPFVSLGLRPIT